MGESKNNGIRLFAPERYDWVSMQGSVCLLTGKHSHKGNNRHKRTKEGSVSWKIIAMYPNSKAHCAAT